MTLISALAVAPAAAALSARSVAHGARHAPAPSIAYLLAKPGALGASGGTVRLTASVAHATTCTLTAAPALKGLPATLNCAKPSFATSLPTNDTASVRHYRFSLHALGGGHAVVRSVSVSVAAAAVPSIGVFAATPATLTTAGGQTTLSASVRNATSCTLSSSPAIAGLPTKVNCQTGGTSVALPANPATSAEFYRFTLTARGLTTATATTMAVVVGSAAAPAVLDVSGTISSDTEWSPGLAHVYDIESTVEIPAGVTLTIAPGTVVKSLDSVGTCTDTFGALCVDGTLDAVGTGADPVTFTSIDDNTVGGATGSGTPTAGEWTGIGVDPSGTIELVDTAVNYAINAVDGAPSGSGAVTIDSNTFSNEEESAISLTGTTTPQIEGNEANATGSYSYSVTSATLNFSSITNNSATTGTPTGFEIGGKAVTSTMADRAIPWLLYATQLEIPTGVTLTVEPGTVLKFYGGDYSCAVAYGSLCVDGTLDATGTTGDPITFTSINDNSVGGATGSGTPAAGEWTGIGVDPSGTIELVDAAVNYAIEAVDGDPAGSGAVTIDSNTFGNEEESAISLASTTTPQINGNEASGTGSYSYSVASSTLNFSSITNNSATDGAPTGFEIGGKAVTSSMADHAIPWLLYASQLEIPTGVTLTIEPGTVLKLSGGDYTCASSYGALCVDGALDAAGSTGDPVTFTSINDNSVGGATGTGAPATADWTGIGVDDGGQFVGSNVTLDYAITALYVAPTGAASINGTILNAITGIKGQGPVDASNVNWGDPSGPFPIGTGTVVVDPNVLVYPWVGETPVAVAAPVASSVTVSCSSSDVEFIGANGSGESTTTLDPELAAVESAYAHELAKVEPGVTVAPVVLDYPAAAGSDLWLTDAAYLGSVGEGVDNLLGVIGATETQCHGERIVLAGYAQGALVVHLALDYLSSVQSKWLSPSILQSVVLVADPAKVGAQGDTVWLAAGTKAGPGVAAANGIWSQVRSLGMITGSVGGALPASLDSRTIEICHDDDLVCAPGLFQATPLKAGALTHDDYTATEMSAMGVWAAKLA